MKVMSTQTRPTLVDVINAHGHASAMEARRRASPKSVARRRYRLQAQSSELRKGIHCTCNFEQQIKQRGQQLNREKIEVHRHRVHQERKPEKKSNMTPRLCKDGHRLDHIQWEQEVPRTVFSLEETRREDDQIAHRLVQERLHLLQLSV